MTDDIEDIARENRDAWAGKTLFAIVEDGNGYTVHQHSADGVFPAVTYGTKREAASRILQLLHIGPVAPQTWPETACIGEVDHGEPLGKDTP